MKFSIITICLNSARYLNEAMDSVLGQEYPELEYVLVDGGSTDGSAELIQKWAERDNRIKWTSEADDGIADAMNRGLSKAIGDVAAFLHADDCYASHDVISRVAQAFLSHPEKCWVSGGLREIDAEGQTLRDIGVRRFTPRRLLRNNIILHPATFIRREALTKVGAFDPSLRYAMDYDLWLRLAHLGSPVELDETLAHFRVHAGSLSSINRRAVLQEEYQIRRKYLCTPLSRTGHTLYHVWRCCRVSLGL